MDDGQKWSFEICATRVLWVLVCTLPHAGADWEDPRQREQLNRLDEASL